MTDDHKIRFSTLHSDGAETAVRLIPQSAIQACPHYIMVPDHYRADGSCKCDDPDDITMLARGFRFDEQEGRWE